MKKKLIVIAMSLSFVLVLVGCGTKDNASVTYETNNSSVEDTEKTQKVIFQIDTSVDMNKVKEKYPEFLEMEGEPFKGIELYVWQMAENLYYCGLMFGTNRNKFDDEIFALQEKALTVDETKTLLNEMGVKKDSIVIYPIVQPYSSYLYEIDDEYRNNVSKLFDEKFVVMGSVE